VAGGLTTLLGQDAEAKRPGPNRRAHNRRHSGRRQDEHKEDEDDNTDTTARCDQVLRAAGCRYDKRWVCPVNANLVNAQLDLYRLSSAELVGADLTGADLVGTRLTKANLRGAIFAPRALRPAFIDRGDSYTSLVSADFTDALVTVGIWNRFGNRARSGTVCPDGTDNLFNPGKTCCEHFVAGKEPISCAV